MFWLEMFDIVQPEFIVVFFLAVMWLGATAVIMLTSLKEKWLQQSPQKHWLANPHCHAEDCFQYAELHTFKMEKMREMLELLVK